MKIKVIPIPNTGIEWTHLRKRQASSTAITLTVERGDLYQTEVVRLEAKYGRVLSKKEMASELGISLKNLTQRIHAGVDIPEYKELVSGRHIFPISAVATYLSKGLVKTV